MDGEERYLHFATDTQSLPRCVAAKRFIGSLMEFGKQSLFGEIHRVFTLLSLLSEY